MKPGEIVFRYFKLLLKYLAATLLLSVLATLGFLLSDVPWANPILLGCGLFLLLNVRNVPMLIYMFHVLVELKRGDLSRRTIVVQSVKSAKLHNFSRTRGGGPVDEKSVLTDTEERKYRFIGDSSASSMLARETFKVTCLNKTGFLLSVELASGSPSEELIRFIYKYFSLYMSLKERSDLRGKVRGRIR